MGSNFKTNIQNPEPGIARCTPVQKEGAGQGSGN